MIDDIIRRGQDFSDRYERMRRSGVYTGADGVTHDEYNNWITKAKSELKKQSNWDSELREEWIKVIDFDNYFSESRYKASNYSYIEPYAKMHAAIFNFFVENVDMQKNLSAPPKVNPNPWVSGTFYLFTFLTIVAFFSAMMQLVPWYTVLIITLLSMLLFTIIVVFQFRNDDRLSETNFLAFMILVFKNITRTGQTSEKD